MILKTVPKSDIQTIEFIEKTTPFLSCDCFEEEYTSNDVIISSRLRDFIHPLANIENLPYSFATTKIDITHNVAIDEIECFHNDVNLYFVDTGLQLYGVPKNSFVVRNPWANI